MSIQMPCTAVRPPSHPLPSGNRDGGSAPCRVAHAPAMPSLAAPIASRGLVLLGLVLIGTLHLAILVAAFKVTPFLTLTFVGAVGAFLVALVGWRVPDDGASALWEQRNRQHPLAPPAAGPSVATTSDEADGIRNGSIRPEAASVASR